ncbi:MAG: hypothetical protein VYA55_19270 [Pseudomonadota bacterium]|nr:hypothetical protein [Pseudomonadota bacterium]
MTTNNSQLHQSLSKGIIFKDFFEILAFQSGEFKDHPEILLWASRQNPKQRHLKSGHALIRNFRKWGSQERKDADKATIEVGGWFGLVEFLTKFKNTVDAPDISLYLCFCVELCEIERIIVSNARRNSGDSFLVGALNQWFCLDTIEPSPLSTNELLDIHRMMLWAALYEQYIAIAYPQLQTASTEKGNPTSLIYYIPKIAKDGKLVTSIEAMFNHLINKRGYSHKQELYEHLASSSEIYQNDKSESNDPKSIRTQFERWQKGKSPFTIKSFKKVFQHLLKIHLDEYDESLLLIVFVNVFSQKQRSLRENGHLPESIIAEFSKYPFYVDKVNDNWKYFKILADKSTDRDH